MTTFEIAKACAQDAVFVALPQARAAGFYCIELTQHHEPLLQRFFVANPAYSKLACGRPPEPTEAHETLHDTCQSACQGTGFHAV